MELHEFTQKVTKALEEYYGADTCIETHKVYKNNGIQLQGVCVLLPGNNIAPTVYLDQYYEEYERGETFSDVFNRILEIFEDSQMVGTLNVDFFQDYDKVKKKLVLRLIHGSKNEEQLKEIPHYDFHNLAVVCHCLMMGESIGTGSILIHRQHLETWGISEEELFQDAADNSPRILPCRFYGMGEMVRELVNNMLPEQRNEICEEWRDSSADQLAEEIDEGTIPMTVLTNTARYYGASCILYEGVLKEVADRFDDDLYILPSSVHEVILIPRMREENYEKLNEMVREVNATQVDPLEWLSDHVYLYEKETEIIRSMK